MKLRIRGNSVRLRLTQSEVAEFDRTGRVEEAVEFGPTALVYALEASAADEIGATFENNRLRVLVPRAEAADWVNSDRTGIDARQTSGEKSLRILVEKDYACRQARPDEDETDAFPAPPEVQKC
jgi:3-methyladenine DNA glycosylase Mpg